MKKLFLLFNFCIICTCAVQTVIVDPVEIKTAKKYLIPKGSIIIEQDTIILSGTKVIKIVYLGKSSGRNGL